MSQAEGPKARLLLCSSFIQFSFPAEPDASSRGLTHKDGEANPSLLAFSHVMNGYRD